MTIRDAIVLEARRWIRTPYHHRARVLGAGVDCVQLLVAVYEAVGLVRNVALPSYPPDWFLHSNDERYLKGLLAFADRVETPLPGDIAVFRHGRAVSHAGIVSAWPLVIHASGELHQVLEEDASVPGWFSDRYAGAFSIVTAAQRAAAPGGLVLEGVG